MTTILLMMLTIIIIMLEMIKEKTDESKGPKNRESFDVGQTEFDETEDNNDDVE